MGIVEFGDRRIGRGEPTYVIAEAGSNHNGDLEIAKELIDEAAAAGVDAVKFQTFRADRLYVPPEEGENGNDLYDAFTELEMSYDWIPTLAEHCEERGVQFLSTPFDRESADELDPYVPGFKVASLTMSHLPFLEFLAEKDKPILLSTGAHDMDEVERTVRALDDIGFESLVPLQCVSAYPTSIEDINVGVVGRFVEEFGRPVGLSDHTVEPAIAPTAAVAAGGDVIEKHFTLDSSMEGPDHHFALEPDQLASMVEAIRKTECALGDGEKTVLEAERDLYDDARRTVHAAMDLSKGTVVAPEHVVVRRPGDRERGVDPLHYEAVVGARTTRDLERGESIQWADLDAEPPDDH